MWFSAICYVVAALFIAFAGVDYLIMSGEAESAPQQAAMAGMALVGAVIPYCFARVVHEIAGIARGGDTKAAKAAAELNPAATPTPAE